jgi:hypothetical protein
MCPIIPVIKSDFLGIFFRTIRFLEDVNSNYSILGLIKNFLLNYLQNTRMLN